MRPQHSQPFPILSKKTPAKVSAGGACFEWGQTAPKAPKSTQIFIKIGHASILFYKFYKFRRKSCFLFNILRGYR